MMARPLAVLLTAAAVATSTPVTPAMADTAGLLGADYSSTESQVTKGLVGAAVLGFSNGGFLTAAGTRYEDTLIGDGVSVTAGAGAPVAGALIARVFGTRWIGANEFRAWRLKAGPFVQWGGGASLGLSFVRHTQADGATATGGIAEASLPLSPRWRALVTGTAASLGQGGQSASGSAGVAWQAAPRFEVQAEAGVARNGALGTSAGQATGGGGPLGGLPLLDRGQERAAAPRGGEEAAQVSGTFTVGLRVLFP